MKKILCLSAPLFLVCAIAAAQPSLMNEATNGLFRNVNDFVIKPNKMFNTIDTRQIVIGGGFDSMELDSSTSDGGLIGYYNPGKLPWSVAGSLNLKSGDSNHNVSSKTTDSNGNTVVKTSYKNPAFAQYEGGVRFTLGVPEKRNLSAGLVAYFSGNGTNGYETERTANGSKTTTYSSATDEFYMTLGFPVGLAFSPSMYNVFEPFIFYGKTTAVTPTNNGTDKSETSDSDTKYMIYDKLEIQNFLPKPFGAESGFWLGIGNSSPHLSKSSILQSLSELETPAYRTSSVDYDVKFVSQSGAYNLIELSASNIRFRLKPMFYMDLLLGSHNSFTFGATAAAPAGVSAPLGTLPVAVFFAVTPALQFYSTTSINESSAGANTIRTETASRALDTNVLWSGKIGTSIIMPRNMTLDITLNMDTSEKTLGLAAQMSIAL